MRKLMVKIMAAVSVAFIAGCGQVDSGEVGFFTEWGQVVGKELNEGLHFYPAPGKKLEVYDIRNQIVKVKTAVFTRDVQSMGVEMAVTYCLDRTRVIQLHTSTGRQYRDVLIIPAILSATKDALGTMEAGDIVSTREKAVDLITKTIQKTLRPFGINISLVSLTNIDYSDAFEKAVEEKQVALQKSIKEKNETARLREVAEQQVVKAEAESRAKVLNAKAEAEAITIKAKAEAQAIEARNKALASSRALIEYEMVKTWDGRLPVQMLGSSPVPFLNLEGVKK